MLFLTFLTLYLFDESMAHIIAEKIVSPNTCPQVNELPIFDPSRFSGRWYLSQVSPKGASNSDIKCQILDITIGENNIITFFTSQNINGKADRKNTTSKLLSDPNRPGRLIEKYTRTNENIEHWILGTDYDSYFILYRCVYFLETRFVSAEIYTRESEAPDSVISKAFIVAETTSTLDRNLFAKFNHKDNQTDNIEIKPVEETEFGYCPRVNVSSNFDLFSFLGHWYLIRRYPRENGQFTCPAINFDSTGRDKIFMTLYGINSRTGLREISPAIKFQFDPLNLRKLKLIEHDRSVADVWILGTDYDSYAVVLRCDDYSSNYSLRTIMIITREIKPADSVIHEALKVIRSYGLQSYPLWTIFQTLCKIF